MLLAAAVLGFTALTHWSLTEYKEVDWFGGDLFGCVSAGCRHCLQLAFAAIFLLGAMEEISWVQRLFDWDTPVALDAANRQEETTLQM